MRNIVTIAFAAGLALVLSGAWSASLVGAVARSSAPASETISPLEMMKTAPALPIGVYDLS